ncbi:ATP-dependent helicase [Calidifontibacter terrae]
MSALTGVTYSAAHIAEALGQFTPTPEQQAIIEADATRPMLVVAGAGSGKTETMASRVVFLVANGFVQPDQVLGLTFTRKAAGQLAERISGRLRSLQEAGLWTPEVDDDGTLGLSDAPTVLTYHSYAGRLVREQGLRVGVEPDARLLTEAAAWQYAAEVVERYSGDMEAVANAESTVIAAVTALAGEMAEHLLGVDEVDEELRATAENIRSMRPTARIKGLTAGDRTFLDSVEARRAILPIVRAYDEMKRSRAALDFADQMALAARLAQQHPGVGTLERRRFRVVLLDEFQDTSEAQLQLLKALFVTADEPVPVTAVGDPHQSIYGWRGASATTLGSFPEQFADANGTATIRPLSTSWRNDRAVLDVANRAAAPLRGASVVPVSALHPSPAAAQGRVDAARLLTIEEEATHVARWIAQRWVPGDDGLLPSAAVLCRKRSLFPFVVDALEAANLPVEVVGVGGLLMTPEVADLVALLWAVQDPTRGDRLMRLLVGPALRLGASDIDALAAWATQLSREQQALIPREQRDQAPDTRDRVSIIEALETLPPLQWTGPDAEQLSVPARARLAGLAGTITTLRSLTGLPLAELVGEAERALGLDIEVLSRPGHSAESARVHLDAFADVATHFSASADRPTLSGFLSWLDAAEDEERGLDRPELEAAYGAVQVLTIHAAKGLEWDHVAVPGLVEGVFPAHNGRPSFKKDGSGWGLGKDGDPRDRSTWAVNDSGWLSGLDSVPYALRGDREALPELDLAGADDIKEFREAVEEFKRAAGEHSLGEERRLAYVALTRAKHDLLLTSSVWFTGKYPRLISRFLGELIDAGLVAPEPNTALPGGPEDENPRLATDVTVSWPDDPLAHRREQLSAGWRAVRDIRTAAGPHDRDPLGSIAVDDAQFGSDERARRRELRILLQERARSTARRRPSVLLPSHLSASAVVQLATDPEEFARSLRRPLPSRPAVAARRGTRFHAWVEQHYQQAALVDVDELPGAFDLEADPDADLDLMKAQFLESEWAARTPVAIEVPVETWINGVSVRGRIDAVFAQDDGRVTIVDWKTGRPPTGLTASARVLQLAAYRLAYARLNGLAAERVDVAFYYAVTGETIRPVLPADDAIARMFESIPQVQG